MKTIKLLLVALLLSAPARASEEIDRAVAAVQHDLEQSIKELSALRESIAAEKIPLAKELSTLEDKLAQLQRQYDQVTRAQDLANLETLNLKNEIKARQDEYTYISNLIDEYARGFESRVHVSELERFAPVVEAAKLAPQNVDLSLQEKFDRQVALVKTSVTRLSSLIGGTRFHGTAVDPQGTIANGQFAMIGPVVLFASGDGHTAGLAVPQSGSSKPAVRPLDKKINMALASVVATGEGSLPLDPTRGGALRELIKRGSLIYYFKKGGPIMWPLLIASLVASTVIIERLLFIGREQRKRSRNSVRDILAHVEKGEIEQAVRVGKSSRDFVARVLTYGLMHRDQSMPDALMRAIGEEYSRFNRGIFVLDTIVTMAPLLGLLGTVTGMMGSFGMLGGAELGAPAAITGGIAEALIATCFGLCIAITCLGPMNYLHSRRDEALHEMEDSATHLEMMMKPILEVEAHVGREELIQKVRRTRQQRQLVADNGNPIVG